MRSSRSVEIHFWWPLPLAVLVWLIMIWGFGFFLTSPKIEIATPPPIEARFVELPESKLAEKPALPPHKNPQVQPRIKPESIKKIKPKQPLPKQDQAKMETPLNPPPIPNQKKAKIQTPSNPLSEPNSATPPADLTDYINQARARRRTAGIFDDPEKPNAVASKPSPSEDEIRMAKIRRNLQTPGTNGIFQIIRIGPRTAEFSFRAWTTNMSAPRLELIQVDAGAGGDVERAIIRRMIQLIRQYHQGDFNWESQRLNSIIVLSARIKDNAGLEDFLMREFFGRHTISHGR